MGERGRVIDALRGGSEPLPYALGPGRPCEERPGCGGHQVLEAELVDRAERVLLVVEQAVERAAVDAGQTRDLRYGRRGVAMVLHDLGGCEDDPLSVVFSDLLLRQPWAAGPQSRWRAQRVGRQEGGALRCLQRLEAPPPVPPGGLA